MTKSRLVIFDICGTLFFSNTSFDFLDLIVQAKSYSLFRKVSKTIFARIINKVSVLLLKKDLIRSIAVLYIKGMSKAELQEKADIFYNQYLLIKLNYIERIQIQLSYWHRQLLILSQMLLQID